VNGVHLSSYTSSAAIASPTIATMAPLGDGVSKVLHAIGNNIFPGDTAQTARDMKACQKQDLGV